MKKVLASIQQGAIDRALIPALEAALRAEYTVQFGPSKLLVIWCEVPRGQAYTEGRLSDISWLMVEVADGTAQPARERAMLAMAGAFARVAGVGVERMMVTLCDSSLFEQYLAANRARIRPLPRVLFTLKLLWQIVTSRYRLGHTMISANY
jgi:hypothetical protein